MSFSRNHLRWNGSDLCFGRVGYIEQDKEEPGQGLGPGLSLVWSSSWLAARPDSMDTGRVGGSNRRGAEPSRGAVLITPENGRLTGS
jgi:hypothetical protein